MKKPLLTLIPLLLLASCGGMTPRSSDSSTQESASSSETSQASSSESSSSKSEEKSSSSQSSSESQKSSESHQSSESHSSSQSQSQSSEASSSIDVSGIVEEAYAGDGVILDDWSAEMKAMFTKYLNGIIPPFYKMPSIRVTYDELGYLSATGDATKDSDLAELDAIYDALVAGGWEASATYDYASRPHMYGRKFTADGVVESDSMCVNGIVSTNYDFSFSRTGWPSDDISAIFMEYGTNAILPVLEADSYISEVSSFYDMNILCLGENITASTPAAYAELLKEYRWQVKLSTEYAVDYYIADSLDALAHLEFYFDGSGVILMLSHGEGERYASWEDCIPAIEDFVKTDLGLESLSLDIPAFEGGALYEIERNARGWLNIYIHKDGSYKEYETEEVYRSALTTAGYTIDATKVSRDSGVGYFGVPPQNDFAIMYLLRDEVNDNGDDADYFEISICSYRGYQGYYVNYEWPGAYMGTVLSHIGATGVTIPSYDDASTYYWKRNDMLTKMFIEIADPAENALTTYKNNLSRYDYAVSENDGVVTGIDPSGKVMISAKMVGKELHITIEGYAAPVVNGTIDFKDTSMITDRDQAYSYCVWGGSPFSFRLDKNTATQAVGNYGDYMSNPLRVYKNQKVTIAPEEGKKLKTVTVYLADVVKGNGDPVSGFSDANFTGLNIAGATLTDSVSDLKKYVFSIDESYAEAGISFVASVGHFGLSKVVADVQ